MQKNKNRYLTPTADIIEFECEDVITFSGAKSLDTGIPTVSGEARTFKYVGAQDWNSVYGGSSSSTE